MKTLLKILLGLVVIAAIGIAGFVAFAWRGAIGPIEPVAADSLDPALVTRGAELAAIGNCAVCHTAPGGELFAGGLPLPTPFGTIYTTNITPDAETGIGRWSETAFSRAMREGVDRAGNHLYPAFPFDHFTLVTDDDNAALYAYLMSRQPVSAEPRANQLSFPLNIRLVLAGWKLLFFHEGPFTAVADMSEEWNRGRYLAEGLGHCGACHTPRNALGAEDPEQHFAGAEIEGWTAYAIDGTSPAPVPWDVDSLTAYLRTGWHEMHGVSRGPMAPVTANLGVVPEEDVRAIATYLAGGMGEPSAERTAAGDAALASAGGRPPGTDAQSADSQVATVAADPSDLGAAVYASACASCHESGRPQPYGGLNFHLSSAVNAPNPQNIINVTLVGLPAAEDEASAMMPGFAGAIGEDQLVALIDYMRGAFSDRPAWTDTRERVAATLSGEHEVSVYRSDGTEQSPANTVAGRASWH